MGATMSDAVAGRSRAVFLGTTSVLSLCVALCPSPTNAELVTVLAESTTTSAGIQLVNFDSSSPNLATLVPVSGLQIGEKLHGIDARPADGSLYSVSSLNRLFRLNRFTGVATLVAALSPAAGDAFTALNGNVFGIDFNPVVDRLRVISDLGQNLRINPNNGQVVTDAPISGGSMSGSAYSDNDNDPLTTTTALYGIDAASDQLLVSTSPNAGTYNPVGSLGPGVNASNFHGFDISGLTGSAYAVFTNGGVPALYAVDLGSGQATSLGTIGAGPLGIGLGFDQIQGLAVQPAAVPEPSSLALLGICGLGFAGYRVRRRKAAPAEVSAT